MARVGACAGASGQLHAFDHSSTEAVRLRVVEAELGLLRSLLQPSQYWHWPKLLVLDLNGLLVYRLKTRDNPHERRVQRGQPQWPYTASVGKHLIWVRPHAINFLRHMLSRFHVAVWSSMMPQNIGPLLELLLPQGESRRLAFVWSQHECTYAGQTQQRGRKKPLFLKETRKIFHHPAYRGLFTPANTLLIDDDEYKASKNPRYTCICPRTYEGADALQDAMDANGGLDARGELSCWLMGMADAESVPAWVASRPLALASHRTTAGC